MLWNLAPQGPPQSVALRPEKELHATKRPPTNAVPSCCWSVFVSTECVLHCAYGPQNMHHIPLPFPPWEWILRSHPGKSPPTARRGSGTIHQSRRTLIYSDSLLGNAMHAVRSFECRPILRPYFWPLLTSFWFHTGVFFSFSCIWDVAHLNCHPLLLSQPFLPIFHPPY